MIDHQKNRNEKYILALLAVILALFLGVINFIPNGLIDIFLFNHKSVDPPSEKALSVVFPVASDTLKIKQLENTDPFSLGLNRGDL